MPGWSSWRTSIRSRPRRVARSGTPTGPRPTRSTPSTTPTSRPSSSSPRRRPMPRSSRPRSGRARRSGARSRSRSTSPRPNRVVALWRETGLPVQMGFMRRFDPGYVRAKALIDAGELGRIEQFRAYSRDTYLPPAKFIRDSGGSFLDMSVHDFDLARFLVGEVEEVSAWGSNLIDQRFERRRRRRHGGDDAAVPQRGAGRGRDVAPVGLGLRHPDRGRGRPRQGRRRGAAQDNADVARAGSATKATTTRTSPTGSRSPTGSSSRRSSGRWRGRHADAWPRRCARDAPARARGQAQLARGTSGPRGRDRTRRDRGRHRSGTSDPPAARPAHVSTITPASVGWRYLSFRVVALGPGET